MKKKVTPTPARTSRKVAARKGWETRRSRALAKAIVETPAPEPQGVRYRSLPVMLTTMDARCRQACELVNLAQSLVHKLGVPGPEEVPSQPVPAPCDVPDSFLPQAGVKLTQLGNSLALAAQTLAAVLRSME